nr:MAG: major capsid protein [Microvirus sp.]
MGELVPLPPIMVNPGDVFRHSASALIRTLPLMAPLMHKADVRLHHWFVPMRLIWTDFEKFITGGPNGNDATVHPYIDLPNSGSGGVAVGSLAHYFGIPSGNNSDNSGYRVSALPFRAYATIFNEFYRDQDLTTALTVNLGNGADTTTSTALQRIMWEKDYFTSARPTPQLGSDVTIALGAQAPVTGIGVANNTAAAATLTTGFDTKGSAGSISAWRSDSQVNYIKAQSNAVAGAGNLPQIYADLSAATGISVIALRTALALQRFRERRMKYGNRYEDLLASMGVNPRDSRLQLPEYLGGGKTPLQISEVLQTANGGATASDLGVGNLRGHGIGATRSNAYRRVFEEHGIVLTLFSVRPKTAYLQSLHKSWTYTTKEDYWQPEREHIGQQTVLNREVKANHATPNGTFGYQDRYEEYRVLEDKAVGEFASTLNYWHMAQDYGSDPALNGSFVQCLPTTRVYAVTNQTVDNLQVFVQQNIQARRLLAKSGSTFTF